MKNNLDDVICVFHQAHGDTSRSVWLQIAESAYRFTLGSIAGGDLNSALKQTHTKNLVSHLVDSNQSDFVCVFNSHGGNSCVPHWFGKDSYAESEVHRILCWRVDVQEQLWLC